MRRNSSRKGLEGHGFSRVPMSLRLTRGDENLAWKFSTVPHRVRARRASQAAEKVCIGRKSDTSGAKAQRIISQFTARLKSRPDTKQSFSVASVQPLTATLNRTRTVPQRLKPLVHGVPTARLKPCPSVELRFIHRGSATPVVNSARYAM
jgi:hypothetical protein